MAIFDFQATTSTTLLNQIEKKLENINSAIISLIKHNNSFKKENTNSLELAEDSENQNKNSQEINFNSYFSFKTCETLDQIITNLEEDKFYISQNSKNYKLFYMILKFIVLFF